MCEHVCIQRLPRWMSCCWHCPLTSHLIRELHKGPLKKNRHTYFITRPRDMNSKKMKRCTWWLFLYVHNIFIKEQHGSTLGGQVVRGTVHRWQMDLISCAASKCRFAFWCLRSLLSFPVIFFRVVSGDFILLFRSRVIYWLFPFVWTTMWTCHQRDWWYLSTEYKTLWISRTPFVKTQTVFRENQF